MSSTDKPLAEALKMMRKAKSESLRDVETATGISNAYLSQLERGDASNPTAAMLHKLATHFEVPYEHLLAWAGQLIPTKQSGRSPLTAAEVALKSAKLSQAEEKEVAQFVQFLVSRRKAR